MFSPHRIFVNPLDPEGSLQAQLAEGISTLEYFQQDDGIVMAFDYRGEDFGPREMFAPRRGYGMIRPEKGAAQELREFDIYVSEKSINEKPDILEQYKEMGLHLTGYIDNRYTDVLGLVNEPDPPLAENTFKPVDYLPPEEVDAKVQSWFAADPISLEESKQPYYDFWNAYIRSVQELLEWNWSETKRQAQEQLKLAKHINKIYPQHPEQN